MVAALLYMINAYRRSQCPSLAWCIARHLECLARHEKADPVIRQIAASMKAEWETTALTLRQPVVAKPRRWFGFH